MVTTSKKLHHKATVNREQSPSSLCRQWQKIAAAVMAPMRMSVNFMDAKTAETLTGECCNECYRLSLVNGELSWTMKSATDRLPANLR